MSQNKTFVVEHHDSSGNDGFEKAVEKLLNEGYGIANSGMLPNGNNGIIRWGHFIKKNKSGSVRQSAQTFFMVKGKYGFSEFSKFSQRVGELLDEGYEISDSGVQRSSIATYHWAHLIFVEGNQE